MRAGLRKQKRNRGIDFKVAQGKKLSKADINFAARFMMKRHDYRANALKENQ